MVWRRRERLHSRLLFKAPRGEGGLLPPTQTTRRRGLPKLGRLRAYPKKFWASRRNPGLWPGTPWGGVWPRTPRGVCLTKKKPAPQTAGWVAEGKLATQPRSACRPLVSCHLRGQPVPIPIPGLTVSWMGSSRILGFDGVSPGWGEFLLRGPAYTLSPRAPGTSWGSWRSPDSQLTGGEAAVTGAAGATGGGAGFGPVAGGLHAAAGPGAAVPALPAARGRLWRQNFQDRKVEHGLAFWILGLAATYLPGQ